MVTHAMTQTFPERRRMLVKEGATIASIQAEYPLLFELDEVRNLPLYRSYFGPATQSGKGHIRSPPFC